MWLKLGWKTYIMTTFWFGSRWALTRLARCPVIQWSRTILRKYVRTSPFSGYGTHLGGGVKGVQGWVPPTGLRGVWVGLARGGPCGWEGGPRPPGQSQSYQTVLIFSRSATLLCCRAAKLLHGAHSRVYLRGEGVVLCSWMRWCWRWVRFLSGSGSPTNMAAHIYGSDGPQILETWEMPPPQKKKWKTN